MDRSELTNQAKLIARKNGFGLVGVAPSDLQTQDVDFWKQWIGDSLHGEMTYLENPKRQSIRDWFAQAQSVLVVGLLYKGTRREELKLSSKNTQNQARIASYATYKDYHRIIYKRLKKTMQAIKALEPKTQGKIFVDANPVLERSYAQLAGIGWIGKNTMMINKDRGSYFFLGGIALNLDLEKDQVAAESLCGTCRACIEACPTQCLEPYKIDATRCLSYITIEKKTLDVEKTIKEKMDEWVFGCDICQAVCPYNTKATKANEANKATEAKEENKDWEPTIPNTIDLKTILSWEEKDYKEYFRGTPTLRAKWPVFLRSAVVLASNSKDPSLIPYLENLVKNCREPRLLTFIEDAAVKLSQFSQKPSACFEEASL